MLNPSAIREAGEERFTQPVVAILKTQSIVVVGNGMASQAFCRWLTDGDSPGFQVTVFGDEPRPAYDRVRLTSLFQGRRPRDLELASPEWYAERGIALRTGQRVTQVDRQRRQVLTDAGERFPYSRLVLATGSKPLIPPIPGTDLPGVFVYRTIEDVQAIAEFASQVRTAAVLGGGLLGLEAAKALRDMHLVPHVVEMAPGLMARQLDRECGEALRSQVERIGVKVHLTRRTQSIQRRGEYYILQFDSGETLSVDMVVISAGIRPRDELAQEAGLPVGPRGGIVVDDFLCTEDPAIHAIGECACHRGSVYGLVAPCQQMARVLADGFRGQKTRFVLADQSTKLKLLGIDVATFGTPLDQTQATRIVSSKTERGVRKLVIQDGCLVGAMGVGSWPEADRVRMAVHSAHRPWAWQLARFRRRGELWKPSSSVSVTEWPADAIVCSCRQVTRSDLTSACESGCASLEALGDQTGAGSVCGSCHPLLLQLLQRGNDLVGATDGRRGLLVASLAALVLVMSYLMIGPIEVSDSVTDPLRGLDTFWQLNFWKQVSGYSLLGITVATLLFSLRKRWTRVSFGAFGTWRFAHAALGLLTLLGVLVHTGLRLGDNLNLALMSCFLGVNVVGGMTGVMTSMESRLTGHAAMRARQWRPRLTLAHIIVFWPLPLLIGAHIFCTYYY